MRVFPRRRLRISFETSPEELARVAVHHFERVADGIVSFGQGCEGEPLLRSIAIAKAIERIRAKPRQRYDQSQHEWQHAVRAQRCIDAGLQAVRISLNSFRPAVYAAYYRPDGYAFDDVFESIRLACDAGLRVSLNLLTHPGVTDEAEELRAMEAFLRRTRVDMIQTRTLNIDPEWYFATPSAVRPIPRDARAPSRAIRATGVRVGNFTHTH